MIFFFARCCDAERSWLPFFHYSTHTSHTRAHTQTHTHFHNIIYFLCSMPALFFAFFLALFHFSLYTCICALLPKVCYAFGITLFSTASLVSWRFIARFSSTCAIFHSKCTHNCIRTHTHTHTHTHMHTFLYTCARSLPCRHATSTLSHIICCMLCFSVVVVVVVVLFGCCWHKAARIWKIAVIYNVYLMRTHEVLQQAPSKCAKLRKVGKIYLHKLLVKVNAWML